MDVQRNLEANVEKRMKDTYGPPPGKSYIARVTNLSQYLQYNYFSVGKKLLVFIDDLNMPQVDTYGTQQPIALLKLLLEKGGMYDRGKDLNWKMFKDIFFTAAMGKVCTCMCICASIMCCASPGLVYLCYRAHSNIGFQYIELHDTHSLHYIYSRTRFILFAFSGWRRS